MEKLKDFIYGFYSIYFAIMFRLDFSTDEYFLEIDRLAFYEEMCYGWRKMYLEGFNE
jgi:hypothetical protein